MKHLITLLSIVLLSSCSTQFVVIHKIKTNGTYNYTYKVIDVNTCDTITMESDKSYHIQDTIQIN
jgi:hypothetical protein